MREAIKKSKWALVAYGFSRGMWPHLFEHNKKAVATRRRLTPQQGAAYIEHCFQDYIRYGGLTQAVLEGASVLEGGPGDNLGMCLRFLASGARRAMAIDKFQLAQSREEQREVYVLLRGQLSDAEKRNFDRVIDLSGEMKWDESVLSVVCGRGLEEMDQAFPASSFDLIVTRGVLQEIPDLDVLFNSMDRVLRPSGRHLHKIDLTDYGFFSLAGHHPLEFLTVPDSIYRVMKRNQHRSNRRILEEYRNVMKRLGHHGTYYITSVRQSGDPHFRDVLPHKEKLEIGVDYTVEEMQRLGSIRPRLQPRFRGMTDDDLPAAGVFLVGRKPAE